MEETTILHISCDIAIKTRKDWLCILYNSVILSMYIYIYNDYNNSNLLLDFWIYWLCTCRMSGSFIAWRFHVLLESVRILWLCLPNKFGWQCEQCPISLRSQFCSPRRAERKSKICKRSGKLGEFRLPLGRRDILDWPQIMGGNQSQKVFLGCKGFTQNLHQLARPGEPSAVRSDWSTAPSLQHFGQSNRKNAGSFEHKRSSPCRWCLQHFSLLSTQPISRIQWDCCTHPLIWSCKDTEELGQTTWSTRPRNYPPILLEFAYRWLTIDPIFSHMKWAGWPSLTRERPERKLGTVFPHLWRHSFKCLDCFTMKPSMTMSSLWITIWSAMAWKAKRCGRRAQRTTGTVHHWILPFVRNKKTQELLGKNEHKKKHLINPSKCCCNRATLFPGGGSCSCVCEPPPLVIAAWLQITSLRWCPKNNEPPVQLKIMWKLHKNYKTMTSPIWSEPHLRTIWRCGRLGGCHRSTASIPSRAVSRNKR